MPILPLLLLSNRFKAKLEGCGVFFFLSSHAETTFVSSDSQPKVSSHSATSVDMIVLPEFDELEAVALDELEEEDDDDELEEEEEEEDDD
jgi:hypothetical protein